MKKVLLCRYLFFILGIGKIVNHFTWTIDSV